MEINKKSVELSKKSNEIARKNVNLSVFMTDSVNSVSSCDSKLPEFLHGHGSNSKNSKKVGNKGKTTSNETQLIFAKLEEQEKKYD